MLLLLMCTIQVSSDQAPMQFCFPKTMIQDEAVSERNQWRPSVQTEN